MAHLDSAPRETAIAPRFSDRIGLSCPLRELAREVCQALRLGNLDSCSLIEVGYEDFNFVLQAEGKKFVVKVFANFRNDSDCERYLNVIREALRAGVATPKLHGDHLVKVGLHDKIFRLCLMDYVDGDNLYRLDHSPTESEIAF
jgi:Ser/Thr protein kinase RdoA (MazF antagonist)